MWFLPHTAFLLDSKKIMFSKVQCHKRLSNDLDNGWGEGCKVKNAYPPKGSQIHILC